MPETSGSPDILQTVIDLLPEDRVRNSHELLRWGMSQVVGGGVTIAAESLLQHASERPDRDETDITTARNSAAREITAGPLGRLAGFVHENLPGVTPSHVTKTGKIMVEGASVLIAAAPDHPIVATTLYTAGSLLDTFDGSLARSKDMDCPEGMIEDLEADLEQQLATLTALSIVAMRRGNQAVAANYAVATMLTPLSAYTRAQAEAQGLIVAEGGLGTRLGRGIMGGIGMAMNKHRAVSEAMSATLAVGTADTVLERRDVVNRGLDSDYCIGSNDDPAFIEEANMRLKAMRPYANAGRAIGTALLAAGMSDTIQRFVPGA